MGCGDPEAWLLGTEEHERCQELGDRRNKQVNSVLNTLAEKRSKVQRNHEAGNRVGVKKLAQSFVQSHPQT